MILEAVFVAAAGKPSGGLRGPGAQGIGGGCSIIPSREGDGLAGPTPAPVKNVPSEQSKKPGSASDLTVPTSDTSSPLVGQCCGV